MIDAVTNDAMTESLRAHIASCEAALEESEARFRSIIDRNADAIYAAAQHLEQIGALLLAADAAAQAAAAYQAAGDRRPAGEAAGTAHRLAAARRGHRHGEVISQIGPIAHHLAVRCR